MGRIDDLRQAVARLQADEADLRRDINRLEAAAAAARSAATKKHAAADRARTPTSRRSAARSAEGQEKKLVAAGDKVAGLKAKLASNAKDQARKLKSLRAAETSEQQQQEHADARRRRDERGHAREMARLSSAPIRYVEIRPAAPEPLRVLYLTAGPDATERETTLPDGTVVREYVYLRVDAEVREVRRALRGSKYRDLVVVEHRPAATAEDLLDAINDLRPHVVHFSGHGWEGGIVFDEDELQDPEGREVEFGLVAELLSATDTPPRLLVLNACESLAGVEDLLPVVPVVVAMADTIDDVAAIVFARHFYASIASAQSIASSLAAGKAMMRVASLEDADLPQCVARPDVDLQQLILVTPHE